MLTKNHDKDPRPGSAIVLGSRVVLVCAGGLSGMSAASQIDWMAQAGYSQSYTIFILVLLGAAIGYVLGGMLGRELLRAYLEIRRRIAELGTTELVLGVVGLLVGLLAAFLISSSFLRYIERPPWLGLLATIVLFVLCSYAGVSFFIMSSQEFTHGFLDGPGANVDRMPPKLLDTSAVIDGRFADLATTGIIEGPLRVPRFVLSELQTLADSADDGRRLRGRRGLDLLTSLAASEHAVSVLEADYPEIPTVDAKLVKLALQSGGVLVTVDHNLTKVGRVQGATVLNINEVAEALRPVLLPGDELWIAVTREGKEAGQGVGHLGDGTMVVVSDAAGAIGSEIGVAVTSVLQTASGRMVFARKAGV